jgi:hypothetical protein
MAVTLTDTVTHRRIVAAGNSKIYYEDTDVAAGSMIELDTSGYAIDTTDQLIMFELLQKVFVVNGPKLGVADFVNTKITVTALTANRVPAHGDILTQDQTGGKYAYMVVDYVNTARTNIYGYAYYAGGATTFTTTHDITSNNAVGDMDPNPIPNANISDVTAPPHWYQWTVYPTITLSVAKYGQESGTTKSFGSLPNKAYLGCNYRGRAKLSGDPEHPHQWFTSRQLDPWDWAYIANDAQSPVKGGDADAGEIGDIVRAIIPYKDDYCIHGCATTMWFMAGDPAEGGSINELDLTIGMFGATSWCFDGKGNLYFWGTNGIYKTTIPGMPECISAINLPNLVNDEDVDPSTHRISMAYDRIRNGILICITKLSDGTNSNYWYDLQTDGFFPESYPTSSGPYSLMFYAANNADYRDLLVGCKDGYIRKFNETLKSDNVTADDPGVGTTAIDSYAGFGPLQLAEDPMFQGKITGLNLVTAGGGINGSQSDSDDITCKIYMDKTAETIVEKLSAGSAPNVSKVFRAPGRWRGNTMKQKIRGTYAGIKLGNDTVDESWGFEQLLITAKPAGKVK